MLCSKYLYNIITIRDCYSTGTYDLKFLQNDVIFKTHKNDN